MASKDDIIVELRGIVAAQAKQIAAQAKQIDELELKLAKALKNSSHRTVGHADTRYGTSAKKVPR